MSSVIHAYAEKGLQDAAEVAITRAGPNLYDLTVRGRRSQAGQFIRLTSCQLLLLADDINAAFRPSHRP